MRPQLYRCGNSAINRLPFSCHVRFNGAATLSLRKSMIIITEIMFRIVLQWGRNFIVAEMDLLRADRVFFDSLQWGRNFIVAEMSICVCHPLGPSTWLQWGRNFIVAEMSICVCHPLGPSTWLQWGRNFIVAEILLSGGGRRRVSTLQWGRNFIVAEIPTLALVYSIELYRFNGAATLSLRK